MKKIDQKLTTITDIWDCFFLNYKFVQKKINYNNDVASNYYVDIFYYFSDTLEFLTINGVKSDFRTSLFNSIGLMQIIYVQQDLIDELLYIFKLPPLKSEQKEPNRRIRNELVGHPIRKFKNELHSSVRYSNGLTNKKLSYIIYSKENKFKGEIVEYDIELIISRHINFISKSLDLIIKKQKDILSDFKIELQTIFKTIGKLKIANFSNLLQFITQRYNYIFETMYFNTNEIEICYNKINQHSRYEFIINYFIENLVSSVNENCKLIESIINAELIKNKERKNKKLPEIDIKIVFTNSFEPAEKKTNYINDGYNYYLSKLSNRNRKNLLFIDLMKKLFYKNDNIQIELNLLIKNIDNNLEYYSSFLFVKQLMNDVRKKYNIY